MREPLHLTPEIMNSIQRQELFQRFFIAFLECIQAHENELGEDVITIIAEGLAKIDRQDLIELRQRIKLASENFEVKDKSFSIIYSSFENELKKLEVQPALKAADPEPIKDKPDINLNKLKKELLSLIGELALRNIDLLNSEKFPADVYQAFQKIIKTEEKDLTVESFAELATCTKSYGPPRLDFKPGSKNEFSDMYHIRSYLNVIGNELHQIRAIARKSASNALPVPNNAGKNPSLMMAPPKSVAPKANRFPKAFCNSDGSVMEDPVVIDEEGTTVDRKLAPKNAKFMLPNRKLKEAIEAIQNGNLAAIQDSFRDTYLSLSSIKDPVIDNNGFTYEKEDFQNALKQKGKGQTCPATNEAYKEPVRLIPNKSLFEGMQQYYMANTHQAPQTAVYHFKK